VKTSLKTRKPIDKLTLADLHAFPIWEFATDEEDVEGQDETWVRPINSKVIPADSCSLSVSAIFHAPAGKQFAGVVGVTTAGALGIGHAGVINDDCYVFIPSPDFHRAGEFARAAAHELGIGLAELFPLTYELTVAIQGESACRSGVFLYTEDDVPN
jgi:hypothetical protein